MKKWIFIFFLLNGLGLEAQNAKASDRTSDNVTTSGWDSLRTYPTMETRWLLLDVGWHYFLQTNPDKDYRPFELQNGRSWEFTLNIFRQHIHLYEDKLKLAYGFALEFDRYEWKNDYSLEPYGAVVNPRLGTLQYQRNSLNTVSLTLPLLLKFESNAHSRRRSLHLAAGGFAAVQVGVRSRQKATTGEKFTERGNFNTTEFRYGLQVEAGYSYLTFYGRMDLSGFFVPAEDSGYALRAWSVGLRLIPFL